MKLLKELFESVLDARDRFASNRVRDEFDMDDMDHDFDDYDPAEFMANRERTIREEVDKKIMPLVDELYGLKIFGGSANDLFDRLSKLRRKDFNSASESTRRQLYMLTQNTQLMNTLKELASRYEYIDRKFDNMLVGIPLDRRLRLSLAAHRVLAALSREM